LSSSFFVGDIVSRDSK